MSETDAQHSEIRRVGIIFSGGPAPASNAVISSAAISFLESGREVMGFFHGYSNLQNYDAESAPLKADEHYRSLSVADVTGLRNSRGILIGTARANPGKMIDGPEDFHEEERVEKIANVYRALIDHEIDALISIGGDDTLKTANFLHRYQQMLPAEAKRFRIVHVPKTIDNDYRGIDFTFGFFTAVDVMAKELQNLRADAMATSSYFVVETMGRKAGWLSYGVAIAGEANLVLALEDLDESLLDDFEYRDEDTGEVATERKLCLTRLSDRIVDVILKREADGDHFGTIVLAEGLSDQLPTSRLKNLPRDDHGHISLGKLDLGKLVATVVADRYAERTGRKKKLTGIQMGYESRCSPPHAFDVMLGSQLGIGAYRGLVEEGISGSMVSVAGQLDLIYVPFEQLIDEVTLKTEVRFIEPGSDFHRLARFLETRTESDATWHLTRRRES